MSISLQSGLRNSGAASNPAGGQGGNRFDDALDSAQDRPGKQRSSNANSPRGQTNGKGTSRSDFNSGNVGGGNVVTPDHGPFVDPTRFKPGSPFQRTKIEEAHAKSAGKNDIFYPGSKERSFNGGGGTDTVILRNYTGKPSVKKNSDGSVTLRYEISTGRNKKKTVEQKLVNIEKINTDEGKIETKNIKKGRFTFVTKVKDFIPNSLVKEISRSIR